MTVLLLLEAVNEFVGALAATINGEYSELALEVNIPFALIDDKGTAAGLLEDN
jgi:hypothetical protein